MRFIDNIRPSHRPNRDLILAALAELSLERGVRVTVETHIAEMTVAVFRVLTLLRIASDLKWPLGDGNTVAPGRYYLPGDG